MLSISSQNIQRLEDEESLSFLGGNDKVEIAFTLLGLKPAFILAWWEPLSKKGLTQEESRDLESFLVDKGLKVRSILESCLSSH